MAAIAITEAELLAALADAARGTEPEDAKTTAEMAESAGIAPKRVLAALKVLHRAGRLQAHRVVRVGIDGRAAKVSAYTVLPAA